MCAAITVKYPAHCWTGSTSSSRVPALDYEELSRRSSAERSADIKKRVNAAREIQRRRFGGDGTMCNAHIGSREMSEICALDAEGEALMPRRV